MASVAGPLGSPLGLAVPPVTEEACPWKGRASGRPANMDKPAYLTQESERKNLAMSTSPVQVNTSETTNGLKICSPLVWSPWTACSMTDCTIGLSTRTRSCVDAVNLPTPCFGLTGGSIETRECKECSMEVRFELGNGEIRVPGVRCKIGSSEC